jgi:hypothetical protein
LEGEEMRKLRRTNTEGKKVLFTQLLFQVDVDAYVGRETNE